MEGTENKYFEKLVIAQKYIEVLKRDLDNRDKELLIENGQLKSYIEELEHKVDRMNAQLLDKKRACRQMDKSLKRKDKFNEAQLKQINSLEFKLKLIQNEQSK